MKKWNLILILVVGMALSSLESLAKSTVIVNDTCDSGANWTLVSSAILTNGRCEWVDFPSVGLVYNNKLLNLSTNTNNFTLEIYNFKAKSSFNSYYLLYQSNNSNLALDIDMIMIRGLNNVDDFGGGDGVGQKITMGNSSNTSDIFITSNEEKNHSIKLQFRVNNSIDILVNETYIGNLNLQGLQSNGSFLILKADSSTTNSMEGFAMYNGTNSHNGTIDDLVAPSLNSSLNVTSIELNYVVNVSGNISDNIGLSFCEIINNQSGINVIYNFTLSGTSGFCSQNMSVGLGSDGVINFTIRVNDTSNFITRSSTILTVGDTTAPSFTNVSINNITSYTSTQTINITAVVTDGSVLNFVRCTTNKTDTHTNNTLTNIENDLWSFASTFAVADYNIPYCYAQDTSLNLQQENTNIEFSVTVGGGGSNDTGGSSGGGGGLVIKEVQVNTTPVISYGITQYSFFVPITPSKSLKYLKFRNIGTGEFIGSIEVIGDIKKFINASICDAELANCEKEKLLIKSGQTGFLQLNGSFTDELRSGSAGIIRLEGNKVFDLNVVIDRPPLYDLIIVKFIDLGFPQGLAILTSYALVLIVLVGGIVFIRGIYS